MSPKSGDLRHKLFLESYNPMLSCSPVSQLVPTVQTNESPSGRSRPTTNVHQQPSPRTSLQICSQPVLYVSFSHDYTLHRRAISGGGPKGGEMKIQGTLLCVCVCKGGASIGLLFWRIIRGTLLRAVQDSRGGCICAKHKSRCIQAINSSSSSRCEL